MSAAQPLPDEPREQDPSANTAEGQNSVVPLGWHPTPSRPVPVVRCIQICKDGHRCKRWSLRGYTKCQKHAGPGIMKDGNVRVYADAVIEAARLRLVDSTDMALQVLEELVGPGSSEGIRLKAATEVLDRAGVRGGFDIKMEVAVTENPSDLVSERLAALAEGALAVQRMKDKRAQDIADEQSGDIIDADIVDPDDDEPQGALF